MHVTEEIQTKLINPFFAPGLNKSYKAYVQSKITCRKIFKIRNLGLVRYDIRILVARSSAWKNHVAAANVWNDANTQHSKKYVYWTLDSVSIYCESEILNWTDTELLKWTLNEILVQFRIEKSGS